MGVSEYVTAQLHSGQLNLASEDLDKKENSPKNLFIWRANLIGSSAKGVEYFMKYLLGAQNSVFGKDLKQLGHDLPMYRSCTPFRKRLIRYGSRATTGTYSKAYRPGSRHCAPVTWVWREMW